MAKRTWTVVLDEDDQALVLAEQARIKRETDLDVSYAAVVRRLIRKALAPNT